MDAGSPVVRKRRRGWMAQLPTSTSKGTSQPVELASSPLVQPPTKRASRAPPYELVVESCDGDLQWWIVDPSLPLCETLLWQELPLDQRQLRQDGARLNPSRSAVDLGLASGDVLQSFRPQTGGGYEEEEAGLQADLEAERELEAAEQEAEAGRAPTQDRHLTQQHLKWQSDPFAFLRSATEWSWISGTVHNSPYMPPIRGTTMPYTLPDDNATTTEIRIEPLPSSHHFSGTTTLASPWMGAGKTTAKGEFQKVLMRESPRLRCLDLDCNRIYSISNAVNLKKTAATLRDEGLAHVSAAGYLDEKQNVDLSKHQLVGCSFESLFKLEGQSFGLVTIDETSAVALKVGGGTMPHFECVFVLRDLLSKPGTRLLALDAAAGFRMSDTEPSTVTEDFLKVVAPHRKVVSVALDPQVRPSHLERDLRLFRGKAKGHEPAWWDGIDESIRDWQTDNANRFLVSVSTKTFGRKVANHVHSAGVPYVFYHGDSNEITRFRDLADPGKYMAPLGCVICTTVLGRGVDMPENLTFNHVHVCMNRVGCDFGDQFQTMLRVRHVRDQTVDVLLAGCHTDEARALLEAQGRLQPIKRRTFEQELASQRKRRGLALRAAERAARVAGVTNSMAPATDGLLRIMAHQKLNRHMQEVDPVYVVRRWATYYRFRVVDATVVVPAEETQAPHGDSLVLDEDQEFADQMEPSAKWKHVTQLIRERGEDGFFNEECYGLATVERRKANDLTSCDQWLIKAYHALKHIGELPPTLEKEMVADDGDSEDVDPDGMDEDDGSDDGSAGTDDAGVDPKGGSDAEEDDVDPAASLLCAWLGNGSSATDLTPALQLQAHCLVLTPEEQMRREEAHRIETVSSRKPGKHVHCGLSLGQKMVQVERFGRLLLRNGFRHVRQIFSPECGIVNSANRELVAAANREILKEMTPADQTLSAELALVKEALGLGGKSGTILDLLRALAWAMGLRLKVKTAKVKQPNGRRPRLVREDPGVSFERVLPDVVDQWLVWCPMLGEKVCAANWKFRLAEVLVQRAEDTWADNDGTDELFTEPFCQGEDAAGVGSPNVRVELIPDRALQREMSRLQKRFDSGAWMDAESPATRVAWSADQRAAYRRHLSTTNALNVAKAIDREAEPVNEATGLRELHVAYGKNSLDLGRRTASAPSMQNCPSTLRRALCRTLYHDIDIVSCHPTLMLQVVRKMVRADALGWSDALDKLVEYAELGADGEPAGRMPMLLRIAAHFGIDPGVAKDVCKMLVLRVLNGGQVEAWCREMGIAVPEGEPQRDLEDLAEVSRIVREAFFAMMERDKPGSLARLRDRIWRLMQDKHGRRVLDAKRKGEVPPQPPSVAQRERTMFSLCIFNLEDTILDCIDKKLRMLGWIVASLIYDGVSCSHLLQPTHTQTQSLYLSPSVYTVVREPCSQLHVRHRVNHDQADLETALRAAEAAVKAELGYTIALKEKPLFDPDGAVPDAAVEDADPENDPWLADVLAQAEEQM